MKPNLPILIFLFTLFANTSLRSVDTVLTSPFSDKNGGQSPSVGIKGGALAQELQKYKAGLIDVHNMLRSGVLPESYWSTADDMSQLIEKAEGLAGKDPNSNELVASILLRLDRLLKKIPLPTEEASSEEECRGYVTEITVRSGSVVFYTNDAKGVAFTINSKSKNSCAAENMVPVLLASRAKNQPICFKQRGGFVTELSTSSKKQTGGAMDGRDDSPSPNKRLAPSPVQTHK